MLSYGIHCIPWWILCGLIIPFLSLCFASFLFWDNIVQCIMIMKGTFWKYNQHRRFQGEQIRYTKDTFLVHMGSSTKVMMKHVIRVWLRVINFSTIPVVLYHMILLWNKWIFAYVHQLLYLIVNVFYYIVLGGTSKQNVFVLSKNPFSIDQISIIWSTINVLSLSQQHVETRFDKEIKEKSCSDGCMQ